MYIFSLRNTIQSSSISNKGNEERVNFGNMVAEIQQKYEREREREKVREREYMNFDNVITEISADRSACPSVCAVCSKWDVLKKPNCDNTIIEIGEEKKICGNVIAKIGEEKKIVIVEIWG